MKIELTKDQTDDIGVALTRQVMQCSERLLNCRDSANAATCHVELETALALVEVFAKAVCEAEKEEGARLKIEFGGVAAPEELYASYVTWHAGLVGPDIAPLVTLAEFLADLPKFGFTPYPPGEAK